MEFSEPAKLYISKLSIKQQEFSQKLSQDEINQINNLCEDLYVDAESFYKALQNSPQKTSLSFSEFNKIVADRKNHCIRELHNLFSSKNIEKRENEIEGKARGLSGEDMKVLKDLEKVTGQSILKKYAAQQKESSEEKFKKSILNKYGGKDYGRQ